MIKKHTFFLLILAGFVMNACREPLKGDPGPRVLDYTKKDSSIVIQNPEVTSAGNLTLSFKSSKYNFDILFDRNVYSRDGINRIQSEKPIKLFAPLYTKPDQATSNLKMTICAIDSTTIGQLDKEKINEVSIDGTFNTIVDNRRFQFQIDAHSNTSKVTTFYYDNNKKVVVMDFDMDLRTEGGEIFTVHFKGALPYYKIIK